MSMAGANTFADCRSAAISETSLLSPAESPARKAAPKAVVSTILGRSMGFLSMSAWNCMRKSLTEAPPSTRSTESVRPESISMASSRSLTW